MSDRGWATELLERQRRAAEGARLEGSFTAMPSKHLFDGLRRHPEVLAAPNRARALVRWLDLADKLVAIPAERNRADRRRRSHKRSSKRAGERRRRWIEPNEQERKDREINRLVRERRAHAEEVEGDVAGLLVAAAEFVAPDLMNVHGIPERETPRFVHWLAAKFGDQIRDPDVAGFAVYVESCGGKLDG